MRKSWFGRTAMMDLIGRPSPFDDAEYLDPVEPRPPYVAIDHVRHARENGCIKTKSEWADELVFAKADQPVTCNNCQRANVRAAQSTRQTMREIAA